MNCGLACNVAGRTPPVVTLGLPELWYEDDEAPPELRSPHTDSSGGEA